MTARPFLIGLAGKKESGKDTVADYLIERHKFVKYAFADPIKKAALAVDPIVALPASEGLPYVRLSVLVDQYGWDEAKKRPEVRRLLQRFGTEMGRRQFGDHVWIDLLFRRIEKVIASETHDIVVSDCRTHSEMDSIRRRGGFVIKIERPGHDDGDQHHTETEVDTYHEYVHIINNNSTIPALYANVDQVLEMLEAREDKESL